MYGLISVRESQEGNIRVFEGVTIPSPREPYVVKTEDPHGCCTLCSLGLDVKHTVSSMYLTCNKVMESLSYCSFCALSTIYKSLLYLQMHSSAVMYFTPN